MAERLVTTRTTLGYKPAMRAEIDLAVEYAKLDRPAPKVRKGARQKSAYVGQMLDRNLLRILVDTTLVRRKSGTILPLLVGNVVREAIPQFKVPDEAETNARYEAYKCAVMKIFSMRRVEQIARDKEKRERGQEIPARAKQTEHPKDTRSKHEGQLRLFS